MWICCFIHYITFKTSLIFMLHFQITNCQTLLSPTPIFIHIDVCITLIYKFTWLAKMMLRWVLSSGCLNTSRTSCSIGVIPWKINIWMAYQELAISMDTTAYSSHKLPCDWRSCQNMELAPFWMTLNFDQRFDKCPFCLWNQKIPAFICQDFDWYFTFYLTTAYSIIQPVDK